MVAGIAREWLGRSGRLPLSIRILSTFYNKSVSSLIDIVNQYSTRWSELDLSIPDGYYQRFHASDNHALIHAPVLRSNIQFDNITHLTLHSMSFIDTFRILRKTPRLVFLQVSGLCSLYMDQSIRPPFLSSLRSLQLLSKHFSEEFLDNLIAPHLKEFLLPRYYITRIEGVTSFFRRSACSLHSFSMTFSVFPECFEALMNILQTMPSLTKLSVQSITTLVIPPEEYHPRKILQLVSKVLFSQSTSLEQGFLPNLKILEYTGKLYLHSGNYNELYPLPPADNGVHGPLHLLKFDLHPVNCVPVNMISYISSLARRGVTVNVLSHSKDVLQSSIDYYKSKEDSLSQDWTDNFDSSLFS